MTNSKDKDYGNQSIVSLKGADRVRKRPAVIFGSDGLEGCEHSAFEIISNSVDEAREGYGDKILITVFQDHSIEVETSDAVFRLIGTKRNSDITGSLFSASFMRAVNTITTATIHHTSIRSD